MPKQAVSFDNLGELGLIPDMPYTEVPPNGWTGGQNVRFQRNEVISFPGHILQTNNLNLSETWALGAATSSNQHYWVHVGPNATTGDFQVWATDDGSTFTDITPLTIQNSLQTDIFIGDILNQNMVFTNRVNVPYFWPLDLGIRADVLPGWDLDWRCRILKSFKGFLIACDMTENGVDYPYRVRWSDEAPPGGLPQSWDATDPTLLAGSQDLGDTTNFLIAALPLRDIMVLYTEKETIGMQFVGGTFKWRFYTISRESGAVSSRAVGTFRGNHVVVTDGDVIIHDGQKVESIAERRVRKAIFSEMSVDKYWMVKVYVHQPENEVWVCYPSGNVDYLNRARTWNWITGAWGVRDLPFGTFDLRNVLALTDRELRWSTDPWPYTPSTWENWPEKWSDGNKTTSLNDVLLIGAGQQASEGAPLFLAEVTQEFAGAPRLARVEKLGIRLNDDQRITAHELWPRVQGGPCTIQIGSQDESYGPVTWKTTRAFVPGTDRKITSRTSGRYLAYAIESTDPLGMRVGGARIVYSGRARR